MQALEEDLVTNRDNADPLKKSAEEFCEGLPIGYRNKFTFEGREWIKDIVNDPSETVVIMKGRQIGWSVLLSALMSYHALATPGCEIIYCTMRHEQFRYFSQGRLRPMLKGQKIALDKGEDRIKSVRLSNGSLITMISGSDEFAQSRGYTADILLIDEAEKLPIHAIANILETQHASANKKTYVGGTGGLEGSDWERYFQLSSMSEWLKGKWVPQNKEVEKSGYHIPQKLSPHWTQEEDDRKKREYSKIQYDQEVLGICSRAAEIPLPESLVKTCGEVGMPWHLPQPGHTYIAGIDLAAGGDADTVICIIEQMGDNIIIREAARNHEGYTSEIYPHLERMINKWKPAKIAIDVGGNKELRRELIVKQGAVPYRMGSTNEEIKYGENENVINRTYFVQKVINRFHDGTISLPIPEPWVVEQLSAERAVTRKSVDRGSYLAYELQDGRRDDLLMALTFAEAAIFGGDKHQDPVVAPW